MSTSAYPPNTHVETNDVIIDEEEVAMVVYLFDVDGKQQHEGYNFFFIFFFLIGLVLIPRKCLHDIL